MLLGKRLVSCLAQQFGLTPMLLRRHHERASLTTYRQCHFSPLQAARYQRTNKPELRTLQIVQRAPTGRKLDSRIPTIIFKQCPAIRVRRSKSSAIQCEPFC